MFFTSFPQEKGMNCILIIKARDGSAFLADGFYSLGCYLISLIKTIYALEIQSFITLELACIMNSLLIRVKRHFSANSGPNDVRSHSKLRFSRKL